MHPIHRWIVVLSLSLPAYSSFAQYIINIAGRPPGISTTWQNGDGGKANSAQLVYPLGICRDNAGNLYVADNNDPNGARVRKIDAATGIITTIAGGGTDTTNNIPAVAAKFPSVWGICADHEGNLLISAGFRVRSVNLQTGYITTIAGTAAHGYSGDGGPATNACLGQPYGLTVDQFDNVYIADHDNNLIRIVNHATKIISSLSRSNPAWSDTTNITIAFPLSVLVNPSGDIYVAEVGGGVVKYGAYTGAWSWVIGSSGYGFSGDGGPAINARLSSAPIGMAFDGAGSLYITDRDNNRIRKVDTAGMISTVAGGGSAWDTMLTQGAPAASVNLYPFYICSDTCGDLFFTDGHSTGVLSLVQELPQDTMLCGLNIAKEVKQNVLTGMQLFPNPNNGSFDVLITSPSPEPATIVIYDAVGRVIERNTLVTGQQFSISLPVPSGIYFVTGAIAQNRWTYKISVVR